MPSWRFGQLMARSGGTIKFTLHDVIGEDEHTVALHHEFAGRGSYRLDQNAANIFHVRDGRISEVWELHGYAVPAGPAIACVAL